MLESIINSQKTEELLLKVNLKPQEIDKVLSENNLLYNNKTYPLILNPIILSNQEKLNKLASSWYKLINNITNEIKENKKLQEEIKKLNPNYKVLVNNLINNNESPACFSRIDGILTENGIKLTEFNMNSPGGLLTLEKMHSLITSLYEEKEIINKNKFYFQKGSEALKNFFINSYSKKADNGLFAIIGKKDDEEKAEHLFWKKTLEDNGIPTILIDYQDKNLSFNGNLKYNNEKIDIIYRRLFPIKNKDLIKAEQNNSCYFINPLYSSVFGNKSMLSLIHKLKNLDGFENSKDFIKNSIIKTQELSIAENINKEKSVIKISESSGGKGVFIGKATSEEKWNSLLKNPNGKIIQEYIPQPKRNFIGNKYPTLTLRKFDFNLYVLKDKAIMPYIRVNAPNEYRSNNACGSSESICLFEK